MPNPPTIETLIGEALSGVAFVLDYLEFHFDGMVLRALTAPTLTLGSGIQYTFPDAGSRDALCSLIGHTVEALTVEEDVNIGVTFSGGARVDIPLAPEARSSPEAAHFVPALNQPIAVW